jgi:hypothetical protein
MANSARSEVAGDGVWVFARAMGVTVLVRDAASTDVPEVGIGGRVGVRVETSFAHAATKSITKPATIRPTMLSLLARTLLIVYGPTV